ncbi:hypothetical protein C6P40_000266 [Pichia californica]|uniref:DNA polymerase epsilon subunit D n=1 Tax=Pichia californica TaxID=460514 RepID=A0A9P7BH30_9ASCO|nr:hypothetical protein C6P42_003261 [[Candida] californica]KAG0688983.1 hypothetical protein C6P40_000266 [[Candida] californica]
MPAKGWRKDEQESNFDTVLLNEHLSIDNFLFPKSTINKISKQALQKQFNSNFLLAKDTQIIIQRSSILFINFIYHHAKQIVKFQNRKVVNSDDIINALIQVGFNNFIDLINIELDKFNKRKESKKLAKLKAKSKPIIDINDDIVDDDDNLDKNKRLKLDLDDTMSDNDSSIHNIHTKQNNDNPELVHSDEETGEEEGDEGEGEEEEGEGEEEEGEEEENSIRHGPSQLELEQRELEGNTETIENKERQDDDDYEDQDATKEDENEN